MERERAPVAAPLESKAAILVAIVYNPAFCALVQMELTRQHAINEHGFVFVIGGKMLLTRL
jgi:hypothetical protein